MRHPQWQLGTEIGLIGDLSPGKEFTFLRLVNLWKWEFNASPGCQESCDTPPTQVSMPPNTLITQAGSGSYYTSPLAREGAVRNPSECFVCMSAI